MKRWRKYVLWMLLPVLAMLLANRPEVKAAENKAAAMQLTKTEGTVEISGSSGKSISLIDNMRLYNGYRMETMEESYAWINLDKAKLAKLDAVSEASVRKSGKKLEILADSGNLFFNVSEPLEEEESLNIRVSTMVVGIRGTCGWIEIFNEREVQLTLLEGTVEVSVIDPVTGQVKKEIVTAGEAVTCVVYEQTKEGDKCDILRRKCKKEDIRGFVLTELLPDAGLVEDIYQETGIDLRGLTEQDAAKRLQEDEKAVRDRLTEIADGLKAQEEESSLDLVWKKEEPQAADRNGRPVSTAVPAATARPVSDAGSEPAANPDGGEGTAPTPSGTDTPVPTLEPMPAPTQEPIPGPEPTIRPWMMPLTDDEVQAIVDEHPDVTILKNPDYADNSVENTLLVDSGLTIPVGKALAMEPGILISIDRGQRLQVDGTLNHSGGIENRGSLTVTSAHTLRVGQNLVNENRLTVPAAGRIIVEGTLISDGTVIPTQGAVIQAKQFELRVPVYAWAVSEGLDEEGYYRLVYVGVGGGDGQEPTPPTEGAYTVIFDSQGGSAVSSAAVNAGERVPEPAAPARSGYSFSGWYTDAACTFVYDFSTPITGNLILYAGWTANDNGPEQPTEGTYTVTFDSRGGSAVSSAAVNAGERVPEPAAPARSGYSFSGWYTDAACTFVYDFSTPITGNLILYAGWTANDNDQEPPTEGTYTVTFDSRGGSAVSSVTVNAGERVPEPAAPARSGYSFSGWYTDAACTAAYDFSTPVTGNLILYAGWTANDNGPEPPTEGVYIVTFDSRGGSAVSSVTVNAGERVPEPAAPTRSGYSFSGWYTDAACTAAYDFSTLVTGDLALYAGWTANDNGPEPPTEGTYTVTFDSQGGSAVSSVTVNAGERVPEPAAPARSGYSFSGWYTDAACAVAYDFNTPVSGNLTLYAGWTANGNEPDPPVEETYTVTFDAQGGSAVSSVTVNAGESVPEPAEPTRSGYSFSGWYTDASCTTLYDFSVSVSGNLTLYAGWTANEPEPPEEVVYTVVFDAGIYSLAEGAEASRTVQGNAAIGTLPDVVPPQEVTDAGGYDFSGWYTAESGGEKVTSATVVDRDMTLYAQWIQWGFDAAAGKLTISGNGYTPDYGTQQRPWDSDSNEIITAEVAEGVTNIGNNTFIHCDNMTSVTLPEGLASIGDAAFYQCFKLSGITIPDSVTSIGNNAFYQCDSLTNVTIPDGVTSIGNGSFRHCDSLKDITIPNSVTSIGDSAFEHSGVNSVTLPDGITSINKGTFADCASLTEVVIPDSVTSIGEDAFRGCGLVTIEIPDSVTSIGNQAFMNCNSLKEIVIPDSVTGISDGMFRRCVSLTDITIPDSVTSIGAEAFVECTGLVGITIPNSVTSIGGSAFKGCSSLAEITIPESVTNMGEYVFWLCENLTSARILGNVTGLGRWTFYNCKNLSTVTIPGSVTSMGTAVFGGCDSLAEVYFGGTQEQWEALKYTLPDTVVIWYNSTL